MLLSTPPPVHIWAPVGPQHCRPSALLSIKPRRAWHTYDLAPQQCPLHNTPVPLIHYIGPQDRYLESAPSCSRSCHSNNILALYAPSVQQSATPAGPQQSYLVGSHIHTTHLMPWHHGLSPSDKAYQGTLVTLGSPWCHHHGGPILMDGPTLSLQLSRLPSHHTPRLHHTP